MSDWSNDSESKPKKIFIVRWLNRLIRWLRNFFVFVGIIYTLVPLALYWLVFHSGDGSKHSKSAEKNTKEPFSLWLQLDSGILEHEPGIGEELFREFFGRDEGIYLPSVRSALRAAAEDKQVKDLHIVIDGFHGGMANIEELRDIIADFKASGKPVVSWVSHMDNGALLIASATDKIHLNPVAEVSLPGPVFPMTYFGEALKKLGVEMQVVKTGKFKSAFEPFIANEPSPESKEALNSVERSLRDQLIKNVAKGRNKQDSEVFLWFQESIFTPAKAKELGIVDELSYIPYVDFDKSPDQNLEDYVDNGDLAKKLSRGYSLKPDEGLGLIEAVGEIVDSSDSEGQITPMDMDEEINWAMNEDNVKAVVIRISSPGGSAAASDFIWNRIRALNEKKPVIISMGSVAASGGYYMAAGGQKIFADASTITGSIGVIGMLPNLEGMKDKWGISFHAITQSNRSSILSGRKMTAADQSYMQLTVEDVYRTFKSRVATSRNMSMEKVEELAQGRIYTGVQAQSNGLVDEIGNLDDALKFAKKAGGLDENKLYKVHRYEPSKYSLSECLSGFSDMRKCFKHHGSLVQSSFKNKLGSYLFGDEFRDLKTLSSTKKLHSEERRVLAISKIDGVR